MKRIFSAVLFSLGFCWSIPGCLSAPWTVFCMGAFDSPQKVHTVEIFFPVFFLAAVLAFWKRMIAGAILLLLPAVLIHGLLAQRGFLINLGHPDQPSVRQLLLQGFHLYAPVWTLGAFAFLTGLYGWPEVLVRKKDAANTDILHRE